eukprot:s85_g1.t1
MIAFSFLAWVSFVKASCFDDAIPESELKDVVNVDTGESYPVGVWIAGDYAAAHLAASVVQIVVQEKVGYRVALKGPGNLAHDAFFALMGCTTPTDTADRGCGSDTTRAHVSLEVWTGGYSQTWNKVQAQYPEIAPRNLGNVGYDGEGALFLPSAVRTRAYEAEGINLDFYRDYNVSWQTPGAYFANPGDLDVSTLLPCESTSLMSPQNMETYMEVTGDFEGVEIGASVAGKCFDAYFWYSAACRSNPSSCVVCLTGGTGWAMHEIMMKATVHNMPLAIAVPGSMENYANLPNDFNVLVYWWVPDPTFLRLKPLQIMFPRYDPDAFAKGDLSSSSSAISVDKHVSQDLSSLAPDVLELIDRLTMSMKNMNEMLLDGLDSGDPSLDVACRWLQANEKWRSWLPEKGKCNSQFGIYDEAREVFLANREDLPSITCRACPSGFFSSQLKDAQGITYVCKECPSGSFQASGASIACNPCPRGSYQNETSSSSCARCPLGTYQDEEGSTACNLCPAGASTALLGSLSFTDCLCNAGSINVGGPGSDTFNCVRCGEGMDCPFSSSLSTLQSGEAALGSQFVPTIVKGYFAPVAKPLKIFRCRSSQSENFCPGGRPGTCGAGLKGEPCAVCPAGHTWTSGECTECGLTSLAWAAAISCALAALYVTYFVANVQVTAQATPFKTGCMIAGLALTALQTLAVLGLTSAKWPSTFTAASSGAQFFVLDLDSMGLNCLVGSNALWSYVLTVLIFPAVLVWYGFLHFVSKSLKNCATPRKLPHTVNTVGLTFQLGFGTMAAVAMKPIMCFGHPNGLHSMVSYPNLFCGDSQHKVVLGVGMALLTVFVLGFVAACSYAAWKMPQWSASGRPQMVQSFRFCAANFRVDAYWFVVPLLFRGLGFAMSIVVGSNMAPAQTGLAALVLVLYGFTQAACQPWKARLVNILDMWLSASFLLLVGTSIPEGEAQEQFAENFIVVVLLLALAGLLLAGFLTLSALLLQCTGHNWKWLVDLSRLGESSAISAAVKECAEVLMQIDASDLSAKIDTMNYYDAKTVLGLISFISAELAPLQSAFPSNRVALACLNRGLTRSLTGGLTRPQSSNPDAVAVPDGHSDELHAIQNGNQRTSFAEAPDSNAFAEAPDSNAFAEAPDSNAFAEVPDSNPSVDPGSGNATNEQNAPIVSTEL